MKKLKMEFHFEGTEQITAFIKGMLIDKETWNIQTIDKEVIFFFINVDWKIVQENILSFLKTRVEVVK